MRGKGSGGFEVEQPALTLLEELVAELNRDGLVRVAFGKEGGTRVSLP